MVGGGNMLALTPQNRTNLHHPLECVAMRMINDAAGDRGGSCHAAADDFSWRESWPLNGLSRLVSKD